MSRLRRILDDGLALRAGGYELCCGTDLEALERMAGPAGVAGARGSDETAAAVAEFEAAIATWRGEPFAGLEDVATLDAQRTRLTEMRKIVHVRLAAALLAAGRAGEAATCAEQVLSEDPWHEHVWAVLIDALTADGRAAEALRAGQRARSTLLDAGLDPGPGLARAEAVALQGPPPRSEPTSRPVPEPADADADADAKQSSASDGRLPYPAMPPVGRDDETDGVAALLDRGRIVTILGPGGVGKTTLAFEVARRAAGKSRDGARLVVLDSVTTGPDVRHAVVEALGLRSETAGVDEQLDAAAALDVLVVLDNCEHVIDAAAEVAVTLVARGSGVRVLATSRQRLRVPGELVFQLRPLALETSAIAMFIERARAIRPDVRLDDTQAIDRIVRLLAGLPLAIEMATAQLATCSVVELADLLAAELPDLGDDRRGVVPRHRSLGQLLTWTTDGLDPGDQNAFAELSVFPGWIDPDAAAAVSRSDRINATLRRLASNSLLSVDDAGPAASFKMLAPVRAYAARQLQMTGRSDEVSDAHAQFVLQQTRRANDALRTVDQAAAAAAIECSLADVRAAYHWSSAQDPSVAAALLANLHLFAQIQVRLEVWEWADRFASRLLDHGTGSAARPDDLAMVLAMSGHAAVFRGELERGTELAHRALAIATSPAGSWAAREVTSDAALLQGRLGDAARAVGPLDGLAQDPHATLVLSLGPVLAACYGGDRVRASQLLAATRRLPLVSGTDRAWVAYTEGEIAGDDDPDAALAAYLRAIDLADSVGDRYVGAMARLSHCSLSARSGDSEIAIDGFVRAIEHWRRANSNTHLLTTLRNLPVLFQRLDDARSASELIAGLDQIDASPTWGEEHERLTSVRRWVADRIDTPERSSSTGIGEPRTLDQVAAAALAALRA